MTIKEQINIRPFKKSVTSKWVFFTPFNILPQSYFDNVTPSVPMCYSLKLTNKILNEKKNFLLLYGSFTISRYIKEGRK